MDKFEEAYPLGQELRYGGYWYIKGTRFENKIQAIKEIRGEYGMDLKQAKQYSEFLQTHKGQEFDAAKYLQFITCQELPEVEVDDTPKPLEFPFSADYELYIGKTRVGISVSTDNLREAISHFKELFNLPGNVLSGADEGELF